MFKISPFSTPRKTQQLQVPSFSVPACIPARRVLCPSASRTDPQGTASCPWSFSSPLSSRLRRARPRLKTSPPQSSAPFSEKVGKANVPTAFLPLVFSSALYSASRRSSSARSASCFPPFFASFPALFFIQSQTKTAMTIPTKRPAAAVPIARRPPPHSCCSGRFVVV
uniref:Transmembrane protein n=1 Tax=Meloidogyne incognita TaxID=6306 RepID=A0A914LPU7_MELIC